MKTEVMLFVRDVPASSKWYQELLGAKSGHGGDEYEMIMDADSQLLFQFHHLDGDEHNINLADDDTPRGAGVLVYVQTGDVMAIHRQAKAMSANIVGEPTFISLAGHTEFIVRDPDGYSLAIYSRGNRTA